MNASESLYESLHASKAFKRPILTVSRFEGMAFILKKAEDLNNFIPLIMDAMAAGCNHLNIVLTFRDFPPELPRVSLHCCSKRVQCTFSCGFSGV